HPVIIDQSIEYHATQIAGRSIQVRHLIAHFDASGVESSSFHGIAPPGPHYSLLQVSSGPSCELASSGVVAGHRGAQGIDSSLVSSEHSGHITMSHQAGRAAD